MFILRPATAHDLPALQAIEQSATSLYYDAGFSPTTLVARDDADLRDLLRETSVLIARDDDDPIGYVSSYPTGPYLHLEEIAVRRDRQRRGCGRRLAEQVLAAAEADPQCSHVSLVVFSRATWAVRLYEALGFRRLADLPGPLPCAAALRELLPPDPAGEPREIMLKPVRP